MAMTPSENALSLLLPVGPQHITGVSASTGGPTIATDEPRLVREVLRGKPSLEVALFSRNDHQRHECQRWNEREQNDQAVDPCSESELKERKGEIDWISAVAVWPRANDDGRGTVAWDGSARLLERANGRNEESDGHQHKHDADRHADRNWEQPRRPQQVNEQAEADGAQINEGRPNEAEVGNVRAIGAHTCFLRHSKSKLAVSLVGSPEAAVGIQTRVPA